MANDLWILALVRESLVSKANLSARSTNSCSERPSPRYGSLSTMILVRAVKAWMACSYCSTVFNSSSVCFLRHSVAMGACRRNQSAAASFSGFCGGLFRGPFAGALLSLEVFNDPDGSCDPGSCDGCNGS